MRAFLATEPLRELAFEELRFKFDSRMFGLDSVPWEELLLSLDSGLGGTAFDWVPCGTAVFVTTGAEACNFDVNVAGSGIIVATVAASSTTSGQDWE